LSRELRCSSYPGDLVLLEKEFDSLGVLRCDRTRAFHRHAVIKLWIRYGDSEFGGLSHFRGDVGRFEQGFRGNAAPDHTCSAECFALDHSDRHSKLLCANCANVSGGSAADEDHIVRCHFCFWVRALTAADFQSVSSTTEGTAHQWRHRSRDDRSSSSRAFAGAL